MYGFQGCSGSGDSGYGDHGIPSFETDSGNCYGCPDSCSRILPVAGGVLLFGNTFPEISKSYFRKFFKGTGESWGL